MINFQWFEIYITIFFCIIFHNIIIVKRNYKTNHE